MVWERATARATPGVVLATSGQNNILARGATPSVRIVLKALWLTAIPELTALVPWS